MGEELTMSTVTDWPPPAPLEPIVDSSRPPRPARGRTLWIVFGSLLLIGGLWWGTFNVVELIAHDERTERFTVPAAQLTRLVVDNDTGSITIVGTTGDEISVEAEVSDGLRETGFSHEIAGSTLELRGSCPLVGSMWCRVTYRIEMPRDLDVEVNADNDRVDVSNVAGNVVIDSDNGAVELADVSGPIEVAGDNGRVVGTGLSSAVTRVETDNGRVELAFIEPPDSVTVNGANGSIEIVVPQIEGGYDVTAETSNGSTDDIDVIDNPESPHKLRLETDNGSISVHVNE
jgi:hypothetical protein